MECKKFVFQITSRWLSPMPPEGHAALVAVAGDYGDEVRLTTARWKSQAR